MKSERIATWGIVLAFAIMTGIAVFSYRSINSFVNSSIRVDHTYRVLMAIDRLMADLQDAETGERGFVITGMKSYLIPYNAAISNVGSHFGLLSEILSDHPHEKKFLGSLQAMIRHRLSYSSADIYLRHQSVSPDPKRTQQLMDYGKSDMDRIRKIMSEMKSHELNLLERRAKAVDHRKQTALFAIVAGNILSFAMIGASILFLIRELSRRLSAEEKLRKNSQELQDLYDNAPSGYHSVDPDGLIVRINQTELNWLGYSKEEIEGKKHVWDLMTPDSGLCYQEAFQDLKVTGFIHDLSLEMVKRDHTILPVIFNATAVRSLSGRFLMSRSMVFDNTDRKLAEKQILELNKELNARALQLESSNKELEGFSYSVSHDLRSPLRAIDGFSRILLEDYGKILDQEGMRILSVIRANSQKMGDLIDDLLAFSRLGRKRLEGHLLEMGSLAKAAYEEVSPKDSGSSRITIGPLPPVWGDQSLLYQVWVNLLANAVKFSGKGQDPLVTVEGVQKGDEVVYSVRDNGVGFDMQYSGKLFGVFQRLHSAEEFPGTGVGLAIVQRVVARHGGRVWAEGEEGNGATFSFSLPLHPEELPPAVSP
ncbi:MAG: sensor histidine kinase [Leptospirales bacterium]